MKTFVLPSLLFLLIWSCSPDKNEKPDVEQQEPEQEKSESPNDEEKTYEPVWADEFDYTGKPDSTIWNREYGF